MEKVELEMKIKESVSKYKSLQEQKNNVTSDWAYWSYVSEEERISKQLAIYKKELHYLNLKEALNDFLDNDDVVQSNLKNEIYQILDEHKKFILSN